MQDLESFFWMLFWIPIHYDGPDRGKEVERFERWNYMNADELADAKKGIISDEGHFLRILVDMAPVKVASKETVNSDHAAAVRAEYRQKMSIQLSGSDLL
ncbi:hypothetical protein D8B26_006430 [Coccidioides posadasii str. Silveira]|uniref:uncharacterized protein n=1 Tax=Coccidioides posadasii (strain RMSCC 757 / Silveira) TaxID=443226 RepID=UPI001BEF1B8F|nr:hypothetical protein D8B26_006430 [Coccidioides posadasii str. Silveira]